MAILTDLVLRLASHCFWKSYTYLTHSERISFPRQRSVRSGMIKSMIRTQSIYLSRSSTNDEHTKSEFENVKLYQKLAWHSSNPPIFSLSDMEKNKYGFFKSSYIIKWRNFLHLSLYSASVELSSIQTICWLIKHRSHVIFFPKNRIYDYGLNFEIT